MIRLLALAMILIPSVASAQYSVVMDLGDSAFVILFSADGTTTVFPNSAIVRQGPPTATNPYPVPSTTMQLAIEKLTKLPLSRSDATSIAKVHSDVATRIPATLNTTKKVKDALVSSGSALGLKGRYPGIDTTFNDVMKTLIGTDDRSTTALDSIAIKAVAWAVWEAGR